MRLVLVLLIALLLVACGGASAKEKAEREAAIAAAQAAYAKAKASGEDLSRGPCIGDPVIPGWVADIAHDPRRAVDDRPENQCASYRSGEAKHFVELDPDGDLIRAK